MADQVSFRPARPAHAVRTDDWPVQATDAIVSVIGTAHDKITGPVQTIARAIVYGFFALVLGGAALVLGTVLMLRLLNNYLPDSVVGEHHMWAAHLIVGLIFSLAGLVLWAKRKPRPAHA
jgi:hypothetical protein